MLCETCLSRSFARYGLYSAVYTARFVRRNDRRSYRTAFCGAYYAAFVQRPIKQPALARTQTQRFGERSYAAALRETPLKPR